MNETCTDARRMRTDMEDGLYEAVRGLRLAYPDLGVKPILAKLREQQPELGAATKEVRKALRALQDERVLQDERALQVEDAIGECSPSADACPRRRLIEGASG